MKKLMTNEYADRLDHWIRTLRTDLYEPLEEIRFGGFQTLKYLTAEEAAWRTFLPMEPGTEWGRTWEYMWLRSRIRLPEKAQGKQIVMDLALSGEATLFVNGSAFGTRRAEWVQTPHHYMVDNFLTRCGKAGTEYELLFEVYAGHSFPDAAGPVMPGAYQDPLPEGRRAKLGVSTFGIWREEAYQLLMDVMTLKKLYEQLPEGDYRTEQIAEALEAFTHSVDFEQPPENRLADYVRCREVLRPALEAVNGTYQATMYAVGNAHLDLAWLWPMAETCRKTARTFAQQLRLLERYPEYRFIQSQPAAYEMCREHYPELYERIRKAASNGQWIADGAMYVEPDTNLPCGEALIRQLLYGKRFFQEEFGVDSQVLWLPDTFGYSAALPQILKGCGVKYLVTQKIFWSYNDYDQFPYHYFTWRGMDGSEIVSYLPTSYTYRTDPEEICKTWNERVQKRDLDSFLLPFGYGDGGGGPCRDHIEYIRREKDLQGMPRVRMTSPQAFFEELQAKGGPSHTWSGELYFSAHRGTYTVQARIKKNNRRTELLLRQAELWSALAGRLIAKRPVHDAFSRLWKQLLLHQFHDILPGSSIARVYEEANAAHERMQSECAEIMRESMHLLASGEGVTCFNSLCWPVTQVISLDNRFFNGAMTPEGVSVPVLNGYARVTVPPMGWVSLVPGEVPPPAAECSARMTEDGFRLENDVVTVRFDRTGEMTGYERKDGTLLFEGRPMNRLEMYKDVPRTFDAWDIDSVYIRDPIPLTGKAALRITESSGLRAEVEVCREIGHSSVTQRIYIEAGSEQVFFDTRVSWHELHRLLKVRFESDIHAMNAIHEIQFGYVERPAHRSSSYDQTRFEVCNHHYTALCDRGRGFALLNDCKYGVSAQEGAVCLTLLRAGASPEMRTDQGEHHFTYAFTAWTGDFTASPVVTEGYQLNQPILLSEGNAPTYSAFAIDQPDIILETVKEAEDESGDLILRLYESKGATTRCRLGLGFSAERVQQCDMLENPESDLALEENVTALSFRPFEIITLRVSGE
ncbi:MAG: glycoside hydrolase family 38 C-terminal domain-containing protein [Clostridia bacterium]